MKLNDQRGQTLLELIVVVAVGVVVVGALTFATIGSIRNAQFSKNQSLSTKYAQEGQEKIRSLRDRGDSVFTDPSAGIWNKNMTNTCTAGVCYYRFSPAGSSTLVAGTEVDFEDLGNGLFRQIQMKDSPSTTTDEKTVTVIVKWTDFSGDHTSNVITALRNTQK